MVSSEDMDQLKTLLGYWIKHNREHSQEFREWAEKVGETGQNLVWAAEQMERASRHLVRMQKRLESAEA